MHVILKCPRCACRWWRDATAMDRRVRCRKCFLLVKVPHPAEVSEAAGILQDAKGEIYVDDSGKLYG